MKGHTDISVMLCVNAAGFFLYDVGLCAVFRQSFGVPFLVHALFCLLTYWLCLTEEYSFAWYSTSALMFEASTLFLNVRWYYIATKNTGHALFSTVQTLFVIIFILARDLWGTCFLFRYVFMALLSPDADGMDYLHWCLLWFCGGASIMLNTYWTYEIFISAMRGPKSKSKSS